MKPLPPVDRAWIARVISAAIAAAVAFALLFLVSPTANAGERIARQGQDQVRFFDEPCTFEAVLAQIDPVMHESYQRAAARFQDQDYNACWAAMGDSLYLVYEDGDKGLVPLADVKDALSI